MDNQNLFAALRAGFPAALDGTAVEAIDVADGSAEAPASTTPSRLYSWRDLDRGSAMLANLLASLELPAGARIAVQVPKSVEALMLYLAALRAGFVYLPLNSAYRQSEMAYFIGDAEPSVVVCAPGDFGWLAPIAFKAGAKNVYTLDAQRGGSLLQRAVHHPDAHEPARKAADDLAAILYTSGTTGRSKGAMLSHGNLLSNALTLKSYWGWRHDETTVDVLIHALPIFHVHGLFVATHGALLNGSPLLWFDRFDAAAVLARLPDATVFMGVPTLYVRLLVEPGLSRDACRNMRLFISGSAPLLIDTFDAFRARTGHTILERYGMSETAMLTSNPYFTEPGEAEPARRGGTVGRALPGVQLRVVDASAPAAGVPCAAGGIGNVEVSGPNVFAGYWRLPEKTAEEFTVDDRGQRWFRTGDVGRLDEAGVLTIVGRSRDLVISGGYNVYPAEIEGVLNGLPGVAESAVIGVPHADFGEAVVAVLVPRPAATLVPAELAALLKSRIAGFKVPKRIVVVDDLPRNAMGKVQKNALRERFGALFGGA